MCSNFEDGAQRWQGWKEGFRWPRVQNYRAEHFAYTDGPLTFGTRSRRPCILTAFSHWAFLRYTGEDLHRRGKLMLGNALPITFYYFAPYFDVLGTEHGWIRRDGTWSPEAEARTNYRRARCYCRPYQTIHGRARRQDAWMAST